MKLLSWNGSNFRRDQYKTAQPSLYPTGGICAGLRAFFCYQAKSQPDHDWLYQAVN